MAINNPTGYYPDFIIKDISVISADYLNLPNTNIFYLNSAINKSTITKKNGTLYDSGGPSRDYDSNQLFYFYLRPENATTFSVSIDFFDSEASYDYLRIYSADNITSLDSELGTNLSSSGEIKTGFTLLDTFNGSVSPVINTYSGDNLVFTWRSDTQVHAAGFKITWAADYGSQNEAPIPLIYTIDGPLSLKGSGKPYTLTVSKLKDR